MITDRPEQRDHDIVGFVRTLQNRQQLDVGSVLSELTAGIVLLLPSAQYAGITVSTRGQVATATATGPLPRRVDLLQAKYGEGPSLSAAKSDGVVRIDDLAHDSRWPDYSRAALRQTPIRSVLSVALACDSPTVGALNIYSESPHAFDLETATLVVMYAGYAAIAWTLARRDEQFHHALNSRDLIGQAKGIVMERFQIDATQAFALLKRLSQSSNTPVAQVATQLVDAEQRESRLVS